LTIPDLEDKLVARLRRTILRIIQRDGPITRTQLSVQVRPHSEHWDTVLDDLMARGIVICEPVIRDTTRRAALSYRLNGPSVETADGQFTDMAPEEVSEWVNTLPLMEADPAQAASA